MAHQSLADFGENLEDNLYRLWNRLASGCYFSPAVRRVEILGELGLADLPVLKIFNKIDLVGDVEMLREEIGGEGLLVSATDHTTLSEFLSASEKNYPKRARRIR